MEAEIYDVVIVGAGPVGLYTGYYCGLRKLKTLICDSLSYPGGQLFNLYPEKEIYDLPGFLSISAKDFISNLMGQVATVKEHVSYQLNTTVNHFQQNENQIYQIKTNQETFFSKTIILASGNGSFLPRKLDIENETEFNNIHYYIDDLNNFKNKEVTVFGGGDSAVDWALTLNQVASSVTLVHRRDKFRAKPAIVDQLLKSQIKVITAATIEKLDKISHNKTKITLKSQKSEQPIYLESDALIVNYGVIISNGFLSECQLTLESGKVMINQQLETNLPGIFACGDVAYYQGREVQIATGLGEGLIASASVFHYIYPETKMVAIR